MEQGKLKGEVKWDGKSRLVVPGGFRLGSFVPRPVGSGRAVDVE